MAADSVDPASLRVADADRDRVIEVVKERTAAGALTLDELAGRVEQALAARTRGELDAVLADLRPADAAPTTAPRRTRHSAIAVMGGAHTRGRWRCGDRVTAVAVMGGCYLDFRGAEITTGEVHVTAVAVMGGIDIVVPEGIEVTMDGLPVMGGRSLQIKDVPVLPGAPRIVVHAFPIMGGVTVRSRPRGGRDGARSAALPPVPVFHPAGAGAAVPPGPRAPQEQREPRVTPASVAGTKTIMFSDVCDYSGLTERLGDAAAHELLREHNRTTRELIQAHGGLEVKSNGDGFMVAFSSVAPALNCAVALQRSLDERNRSGDGEAVRVHIGIHAGDVVSDGNDFLGTAVIVASRLADVAGPEEILVSAVARELASGNRDVVFTPPRRIALKGFSEAREVYAVDWRA